MCPEIYWYWCIPERGRGMDELLKHMKALFDFDGVLKR
ncbi:hypothetical protein OCC_14055 [Thermococcus litoralis DSM 5473]|uniref:Uncharacterized protein n=1 Tax=Thermococcus litoralis (strain ATCC 51850 / DSM 5473 / JCM 8560 / NS-C) TaxID=523849 RepID=S5ZB56_THELN|nr:hypothetical protein OCC_14055 [Thermococcus litoralis DSM 5473]